MTRPRAAKGSAKLSHRQQRFVREYLIDLNATQAAIRAGYSRKTADVQGPRVLGYVRVAAAIKDALDKRGARTDITADRVLRELARIGFADIRQVFDETGRLHPVPDLSADVAASIASVEVVREKTTVAGEVTTEESLVKVKAWDKLRALEMLGKHLGILKDQVEYSLTPMFSLPAGTGVSVSPKAGS